MKIDKKIVINIRIQKTNNNQQKMKKKEKNRTEADDLNIN